MLSALLDLVGDPGAFAVTADRTVQLPNGRAVPRRWRIRTGTGRTAVELNVNFGPGFPQRTMYVRGLFGAATFDLDADACVVDQRTPQDIDLDRYQRGRSLARQLTSQARHVLANYVLGKLKLRKAGNPYQNSTSSPPASASSRPPRCRRPAPPNPPPASKPPPPPTPPRRRRRNRPCWCWAAPASSAAS